MINTTCAVDLAELEGDEATGADVCQEYKVVLARRSGRSPRAAAWAVGRSCTRHGRRRRPPLCFR